jgi:hypothetical protein
MPSNGVGKGASLIDNLTAALEYAQAGFPVFPLQWIAKPAPPDIVRAYRAGELTKDVAMGHARCSCGNPACRSPGKHPLHVGNNDATTDANVITRWWSASPEANVGVAMPSGKFGIDFDTRVPGVAARLAAAAATWPPTLTQTSGDGGEHWIYRGAPEDFRFAACLDGERGVDVIRPGHRYLVAAPAVHWTGDSYTWKSVQEIAEAPAELLARVASGVRSPAASHTPQTYAPGNIARDAVFSAMLAALGDANEHGGQRWYLCGAIGGVMRKIGFYSREDCADLIRAWLSTVESCNVEAGVVQACGAWDKPSASVSGVGALTSFLGEARTNLFVNAMSAYRAWRRDDVAPEYAPVAEEIESDRLLRHGRMVDRSLPPPPLVYVIEGLDLAQGKVSAIQAFANVAKTPFALLMAICVAAGKPFLGFEVKQRNTLFLAFEGGILTEEREARLCAGLGLKRQDVPLHFMHVDSVLSETFLSDLEAYIVAHEIGAVVFDTYGSALPGDIEHNSDKFSFWLKQLGKLSDATMALIIVLLHENKNEAARGLRKMSGHNSAPGAIQAAIGLERRSEERTVIEVYCSREVRKAFPRFAVAFRDVPCEGAPTGLSLVAEKQGIEKSLLEERPQTRAAAAAAARAAQDAGRAIFDTLKDGQPHTRKELVGIGGEGTRPADKALALLRRSQIADYIDGYYTLSENGATVSATRLGLVLSGQTVTSEDEIIGGFARPR